MTIFDVLVSRLKSYRVQLQMTCQVSIKLPDSSLNVRDEALYTTTLDTNFVEAHQ